jgi:inosine/xanthosine triphosphatase
MKIIVASKNPVKINASLKAFRKMFPKEVFVVEGIPVPSGVGEQPMSDQEALQGALNRAANLSKVAPKADFWVGLEGSVEEVDGEMRSFAWAAVKSRKQLGKARTATFVLPQKIAELIKQGIELGEADDIVFHKANSKLSSGAVGILTDEIIDRTEFYWPAVALALIPFKNTKLY